jgi:hypothetical protein
MIDANRRLSQGLRRSTTALAASYRPPARFRSRRAILLKPMAKKVAQQLTQCLTVR